MLQLYISSGYIVEHICCDSTFHRITWLGQEKNGVKCSVSTQKHLGKNIRWIDTSTNVEMPS